MKLKVMLFLILVLGYQYLLFSQTTFVKPNDYMINQGDAFIIQSLIADSLSIYTYVMPTGALSLYPFADTVMVGGGTLSDAMNKIENKIGMNVTGRRVLIHFARMGTFMFNITGAVARPNTHRSDMFITLTEALSWAGGLIISASREINIFRNGQMLTFDLNKYYAEGDITQNPLIMPDDKIIVGYAKDFVNVYTNTVGLIDLVSVELKPGKTKISDILVQLPYKHAWTDKNSFTVIRGENANYVDINFELQAGDKLFVAIEEFYVYVTGYVHFPGKFPYNGKLEANYYIALSGGPRDNGSRSKVYLIRQGSSKREVYTDQIIEPGDTIDIPESGRSIFITYLAPVATIVSLALSILVLARQ